MKKLIFLYILLLSVTFGKADVPELKSYATDLTGTLSQTELHTLDYILNAFEDSTSNQVVFLMISSLDDYPIEMYTYDVASKNKIGTTENNNGVLFLVAKDDRKLRIEVGYGLEGALPDALASSIIRNEVAPYFRKGDFYGGIRAGLNSIMLATIGEYTRQRDDTDEDRGGKGFLPIIYIIIFILMAIFGRGRRGGLGLILLGSALGSSGRRGGGGFGGFSGGGGGGFGGFSGGGGSFGGGGASGGW